MFHPPAFYATIKPFETAHTQRHFVLPYITIADSCYPTQGKNFQQLPFSHLPSSGAGIMNPGTPDITAGAEAELGG